MMKESYDASERILKGMPNRVKSPTEENRPFENLSEKIKGPIMRKL